MTTTMGVDHYNCAGCREIVCGGDVAERCGCGAVYCFDCEDRVQGAAKDGDGSLELCPACPVPSPELLSRALQALMKEGLLLAEGYSFERLADGRLYVKRPDAHRFEFDKYLCEAAMRKYDDERALELHAAAALTENRTPQQHGGLHRRDRSG